VTTSEGDQETVLAFLTTTCAPCEPLWEKLARRHEGTAPETRVVVVTPSASMENERRARQLTPPGVHLHMGSETWFSYGVHQAGTFLLVRSRHAGPPPWEVPGQVLATANPAGPWELEALLGEWSRLPSH
jgi:hypothetical protein